MAINRNGVDREDDTDDLDLDVGAGVGDTTGCTSTTTAAGGVRRDSNKRAGQQTVVERAP